MHKWHTSEKIGIKKISVDNFKITPCTIQFNGSSITLGNGIKRAFPTMNTDYSDPCSKYIEQFFVAEMPSVFQFETSKYFSTTQLIQKLNDFHLKYKSKGNKPDLHYIFFKIKPSLNRIKVNDQPGLNQSEKLKLCYIFHQIILNFVNDLLRETNQLNGDIKNKMLLEYIRGKDLRHWFARIILDVYLFLLYLMQPIQNLIQSIQKGWQQLTKLFNAFIILISILLDPEKDFRNQPPRVQKNL